MKHSILTFSLVLGLASTSFAAWNIECHGQNGAHLNYSTSSFSGKPLLHIVSKNFAFNLMGTEQIHLESVTEGEKFCKWRAKCWFRLMSCSAQSELSS